MKKFRIKKIHVLAALVFGGFIQTNCNGEELDSRNSDNDLRIRGIFDGILPNTERKYTLKIILHPHFGDLHRHSYLRVPLGLRYGLSERLELAAEWENYFSHGFGSSGLGKESGISGIRISSKYHASFFERYNWDQAIGFDYSIPIGAPPVEITDGLTHFRPYMNFAKRLESNKNVRLFWGVGLDLVGNTSVEGTLRKNALGENAQTFTFGGVWEREKLSYTFETVFATSRFIGNNDRGLLTIRPGIIWKVPRKYTFNSKGNWILGIALKGSQGRDGVDIGFSLKVKVNLDFKK